jgi:hypothetical protein
MDAILANDPRNQLEPWLEEIETHARNICAQMAFGTQFQPIWNLANAAGVLQEEPC